MIKLFSNYAIEFHYVNLHDFIYVRYKGKFIDYETAKSICAERIKIAKEYNCSNFVVLIDKGTKYSKRASEIFSSIEGTSFIDYIAIMDDRVQYKYLRGLLNLLTGSKKKLDTPFTKFFKNYKDAVNWIRNKKSFLQMYKEVEYLEKKYKETKDNYYKSKIEFYKRHI